MSIALIIFAVIGLAAVSMIILALLLSAAFGWLTREDRRRV